MQNFDDMSGKAAQDAVPHYTAAQLKAVEEHVQKFFGTVQCSLLDDGNVGLSIAIDIIAADAEHGCSNTMLITKGMGAHRMSVPEDVVQAYRAGKANDMSAVPFERCELYMSLPASSEAGLASERADTGESAAIAASSRPVAMLSVLAQLPYLSGQWIGHGHVFTFKGEMAEAMPFQGAMLLILPPRQNTDAQLASASLNCELPNNVGRITFYQVVPLTADELAYTADLPYTSIASCMRPVHGLSVDRHYSSLECVWGPIASC